MNTAKLAPAPHVRQDLSPNVEPAPGLSPTEKRLFLSANLSVLSRKLRRGASIETNELEALLPYTDSSASSREGLLRESNRSHKPRNLRTRLRAGARRGPPKQQMLCIRDAMLAHSRCGRWRTLGEIRSELEGQLHRRFPEASISAQLRHLRKREFGSYRLLKQRRSSRTLGLFEYQLLPPDPMNAQPELFEASAHQSAARL